MLCAADSTMDALSSAFPPAANLKALRPFDLLSLSYTLNPYQANCSGKTRTRARCRGRLAILWFAAVEHNDPAFCGGSIDRVKAVLSALLGRFWSRPIWHRAALGSLFTAQSSFSALNKFGACVFRVDVAGSDDAAVHKRASNERA